MQGVFTLEKERKERIIDLDWMIYFVFDLSDVVLTCGRRIIYRLDGSLSKLHGS